ncbi:hypothetical protein L195_g031989, partial [Trifolium pratense]
DDILIASSNEQEIQKLKMKDLARLLEEVVERFGMIDSKVVNTPIGHRSKLSIKQRPQSEEERKKMEKYSLCLKYKRTDPGRDTFEGYVDADYAGVKEAIWLKGMIGYVYLSRVCVKIYCDNQSAIHLANHQVYFLHQAKDRPRKGARLWFFSREGQDKDQGSKRILLATTLESRGWEEFTLVKHRIILSLLATGRDSRIG